MKSLLKYCLIATLTLSAASVSAASQPAPQKQTVHPAPKIRTEKTRFDTNVKNLWAAAKAKTSLMKVPGVVEVDIDAKSTVIMVEYDVKKMDVPSLIKEFKRIGVRAEPIRR